MYLCLQPKNTDFAQFFLNTDKGGRISFGLCVFYLQTWLKIITCEKRHYKIFWKTINIYILDVSMVYNSPKGLEPVCVRSFDLSMAVVQRRGPVRITLQHFIGRFACKQSHQINCYVA